MMVKVDGRWTVVAVASSHDEGCAEEGDIGLLTLVSPYVRWIMKTIHDS